MEIVVLVAPLSANKLAIALRQRDNLIGGGKVEFAAHPLGSIPLHALARRELTKFLIVTQLLLVCRITEFSYSHLLDGYSCNC